MHCHVSVLCGSPCLAGCDWSELWGCVYAERCIFVLDVISLKMVCSLKLDVILEDGKLWKASRLVLPSTCNWCLHISAFTKIISSSSSLLDTGFPDSAKKLNKRKSDNTIHNDILLVLYVYTSQRLNYPEVGMKLRVKINMNQNFLCFLSSKSGLYYTQIH